MQRRDPYDIVGGLGVAALGAFVMWEATAYQLGELRRMGPGYFPMLLGILLVGFGLLITLEGMFRPQHDDDLAPPVSPSLRPVLAIPASLLVFAYLLPALGLAPATAALVIVASLSEQKFRPVMTLVAAAGLSAIAVVVFIHGFGMPLRAFR